MQPIVDDKFLRLLVDELNDEFGKFQDICVDYTEGLSQSKLKERLEEFLLYRKSISEKIAQEVQKL